MKMYCCQITCRKRNLYSLRGSTSWRSEFPFSFIEIPSSVVLDVRNFHFRLKSNKNSFLGFLWLSGAVLGGARTYIEVHSSSVFVILQLIEIPVRTLSGRRVVDCCCLRNLFKSCKQTEGRRTREQTRTSSSIISSCWGAKPQAAMSQQGNVKFQNWVLYVRWETFWGMKFSYNFLLWSIPFLFYFGSHDMGWEKRPLFAELHSNYSSTQKMFPLIFISNRSAVVCGASIMLKSNFVWNRREIIIRFYCTQSLVLL